MLYKKQQAVAFFFVKMIWKYIAWFPFSVFLYIFYCFWNLISNNSFFFTFVLLRGTPDSAVFLLSFFLFFSFNQEYINALTSTKKSIHRNFFPQTGFHESQNKVGSGSQRKPCRASSASRKMQRVSLVPSISHFNPRQLGVYRGTSGDPCGWMRRAFEWMALCVADWRRGRERKGERKWVCVPSVLRQTYYWWTQVSEEFLSHIVI